MLSSTKHTDTVTIPVSKDTMECTFESCTFDATDHWSGTREEILFVLEEHVRTGHSIPTMELVEGYITRTAWETFRDWWQTTGTCTPTARRFMAQRRMS
jgi:hypothetical protein